MTESMPNIRENYKEDDAWSFDEAADFAGVSRETVRQWFYNGKKFERARQKGEYIIDAQSFNDYLINGQ